MEPGVVETQAEPKGRTPGAPLLAWRAKAESQACWTEVETGFADLGGAGGSEDNGGMG